MPFHSESNLYLSPSLSSVALQDSQVINGILHVPDDYETIQMAIDSATDGDEIIVAPGLYNEAIDFLGKAIYLHSSGGPQVTFIGARPLYKSVVKCMNGEGPSTILEGFTLTGGFGTLLSDAKRYGGGMINLASSPTIRNCIFSGNQAGWGMTYGSGGGMCNIDSSSPAIINCTFIENLARNWYPVGKLIDTENSTSVDSKFPENFLDETGAGGGMYNRNSSPILTNCKFIGNNAYYGAGMSNDACNNPPTMVNCLFTGNCAYYVGGGVYNYVSNSTFISCTFSNNTVAYSDGGCGIFNHMNCNTTVTNCILWGDLYEEIVDILSFSFVTYSNVQGSYQGEGNINTDPFFADPGHDNYRISYGSPCIDAGNNEAIPEEITIDLDGNSRLVDDPATEDTGYGEPPIVDMGAYEFQVGDINGDGKVNTDDLLLLLAAWGEPGGPADINGDGIVNTADLLILLANWG